MARKRPRVVSSTRVDGITVATTDQRKVFIVYFALDLGAGRRFEFKRKSPFQTVGESREWGRQQRAALLANGGRAKKVEPRADPDAPRSFAYWAKRYLDDAGSPARRGGANRESTVDSKRIILESHLLPFFGSRGVTTIDDDLVEAFVLEQVGRNLAFNTIKGHLDKLSGVLRLAKKKGCPAERALELPEVRLEKKDEVLPATLSEAQTDQLLIEYRKAPKWQRAVLSLLFRCGLRIGEALGLMWSDINIERRTIIVQRSAGRFGIGPTKGGKVRTVHLHHQVRDALLALGPGTGESWVFGNRSGTGPRHYNSTRRIIGKRWPEFIGDDGKPVKWKTHLGRHTLGRHWAERGWGLKGLQEMLGHADIQTTMIYAHWSQATTGHLLDQLGAKVTLVRTPRARG